MASASGNFRREQGENWRSRVVVGPLKDDFLRPFSTQIIQRSSQQERGDRELAIQLTHQQRTQPYVPGVVGHLVITVVEATFVKNYGMTRMDPYVRLRIGHTIYETHACMSGGRTPRWNKRIQCYLPAGVKQLSIEVYDECALTMDELIAFGQISIPQQVFQYQSADDWFPLSGKQGENKEGSLHLVFSLMPIASSQLIAPGAMGLAMAPAYATYPAPGASIIPVNTPVMIPGYGIAAPNAMPFYPAGQQPSLSTVAAALPTVKPLSPEELKEIQSMFPSVDPQVIQSVIEACGGRREAIIDSLLQLSNQ